MEEKEGGVHGSRRVNRHMDFAGCLSIQLPYCRFMAIHVHCYFTVPLGEHKETSWKVIYTYIYIIHQLLHYYINFLVRASHIYDILYICGK